MKEWWGEINNPFVKGVTACALSLFLALNFPMVFLAVVTVALSYAIALPAVAHAYRKRHALMSKSDLAVRFVWMTFSEAREGCSRTVVHALEKRKRRKLLRQQKEERLRHYKRERNRRKREQARRALAQR